MQSTKFASPDRNTPAEIQTQYKAFLKLPFLHEIMDLLPQVACILNRHRQILVANRSLLTLFNINAVEELLGAKPGEVFHCIHAEESDNGCGTTEYCKVCGVVHAILESQKHHCTITCKAEVETLFEEKRATHEVLVTASPFEHSGNDLTFVSLADISGSRKRAPLNRMFFHDIENTSSIIEGFCNLMEGSSLNDQYRFVKLIREATTNLLKEIRHQRELHLAEQGELLPLFGKVSVLETLFKIKEQFRYTCEKKKCEIVFRDPLPQGIFYTDEALLMRVLQNLVSNGLEAIGQGDKLQVFGECQETSVVFSIFSDSFIPYDEQRKIFKKGYSTKGKGRGIGTYAAKLLVNQYLKGELVFESEVESGTLFTVTLPINES